mmetsp:Transcript_63681/g.176614  ORF Transcript_63681/g.176614 Transcript_63681/m.176614 type:complete len:220 (+) Transcript_63681:159-818(+)
MGGPLRSNQWPVMIVPATMGRTAEDILSGSVAPLLVPLPSRAVSPSMKRMSSVLWWVYRPASCTGKTHAATFPSLWCECHQPGGVTKTPPLCHSARCASMIVPFALSMRPRSVYTLPCWPADTARSRATELCLCGSCRASGPRVFSSDQRVGVSVFVCGVAGLPNRMPRRFLTWPCSSTFEIDATESRIRSPGYSVGSKRLTLSGRTPRYFRRGSSWTQ